MDMVTVPSGTVATYKDRIREHCAVPALFDPTHCIACSNAKTETTEGEFEHRRTGLREKCWDALAQEASAERETAAMQQCTRLNGTRSTFDFLTTWIAVTKSRAGGTVTTSNAHARHVVSVVVGREALPNLWMPNRHPSKAWTLLLYAVACCSDRKRS